MFLLDLLSQSRRTLRIRDAQDRLNERLLRDRDFSSQQSMHPRHAAIGKWITPTAGRRVLELGCGPGRYVAMLSSMGFQVVGVDPASFDFWSCLRTMPNVILKEGVRAENLPFDDASFDHICCLGALLYFDDPGCALAEMKRVLRPGGRLVLRTVNKENRYTKRTGRLLDPASKSLYTFAELGSFLEAGGFTVVDSFQYGYFPSYLPDFYWYLLNVYLRPLQEEALSNRIPQHERVNNIFHATRA